MMIRIEWKAWNYDVCVCAWPCGACVLWPCVVPCMKGGGLNLFSALIVSHPNLDQGVMGTRPRNRSRANPLTLTTY